MSTDNDDLEQDQEQEIPEDAVVIKQVTWAWLWSSAPWIAAIFVLYNFLAIDPIIASVLLLIIILPRYWQWRRTAYILTDDNLIYQRGGLLSSRKYNIPFAKLVDVRSRDGMFGRGLGYQAVDIEMANGSVASLTYLPPLSGVAEHLQEMIDASEPEAPEGGDAEELSDEPSSPGQDGSPDDKASTD